MTQDIVGKYVTVFGEGGLRGLAGRRGQNAVVVVRDRFGKRIGVGSGPVWGDWGGKPTIDRCARTVIDSGWICGAQCGSGGAFKADVNPQVTA